MEFTYITMTYAMHAVMSVGAAHRVRRPRRPDRRDRRARGLRRRQHRPQIDDGRMTTATSGPLDGVRVLELGNFIAGPFAGQLLGDYGADVIKVEAPGRRRPDAALGRHPRRRQPVVADASAATSAPSSSTCATNAGRQIAADSPRSATWCSRTSARARSTSGASVLRRAGRAATRSVVLVHVSGFGQTGPLAAQAGFGSVGEAMGGIRHTTGAPDRPPSRAGICLGDALAVGVRRHRHARRAGASPRHGQGPRGRRRDLRSRRRADGIDDGRLRARRRRPACGPAACCPASRRRTSTRPPTAPRSSSPPTPTACSSACATRWADPNSPPTHASRPITPGARTWPRSTRSSAAWTATLPCDELLGVLDAHGVPAGRIFTAPDMLTDPQYLARDMVRRITSAQGWEVPMTGVVPRFSDTPGTSARRARVSASTPTTCSASCSASSGRDRNRRSGRKRRRRSRTTKSRLNVRGPGGPPAAGLAER